VTADTEAAPGFTVAVAAGAAVGMGRTMALMAEREAGRQAHDRFDWLHQVPIGPQQITLTAGAGNLQQTQGFGPDVGYMWGVRRLVAVGFTAGTVVAYKNGTAIAGTTLVGGEPLIAFNSAGVATIGRAEVILDYNDTLNFTATGITGTVQIFGAADNFERWMLPKYLGG